VLLIAQAGADPLMPMCHSLAGLPIHPSAAMRRLVEPELRGFAYEGAAAYTLLDAM
jgi:hypothetical protein